jgi:aminopeptidase YwaD
MLKWVADMIKKYGGRKPGSEIIGDILEAWKPFGKISAELFTVKKGSFHAIMPVVAFLVIAATFMNTHWLGIIIWGSAIGTFIAGIGFYMMPLDSLFKPVVGANAVCDVLATEEEEKQVIVIAGHHDSAPIFRFLNWSPILYLALNISGMLTLTVGFVFYIFNLFPMIVDIAVLVTMLPFFFFTLEKYSMGAGDNLIATAIVGKLLQYYSKHPLPHTTIRGISFDAEEEGLIGSRSHVIWRKYDPAKTLMINIESLYKLKDLKLMESDLNGFIQYDQEFVDMAREVALNHVDKMDKFPMMLGFGGTDAASFAQVGVKAVTFIGVSTNPFDKITYHTERDTVDSIEPEIVEKTYSIVKELIKCASLQQ